ncbi:MAG: high-affinity branched-chain amino acid ABC transporter permease LivM [Thermodesulfobacteriota bacterium]
MTMLLAALRDTLWLSLLAFPLAGFDLAQRFGEEGKEVVFRWHDMAGICAILFVTRILFGLLAARRAQKAEQQGLEHSLSIRLGNYLTAPKRRGLLLSLLAGLALITPFMPFVSKASLDVLTLAFIYVILGLGLNIVVGLAGLLDLGYVGFYAVGAYGYGLLYQYWGLSFWQALPACGVMAALFGVVLGFPVLRLRGDYLAIVTLGFGEIIRLVLNNWDSFTNGPNGISGIPRPTLMGLEFNRSASEGAATFHEFFGLEYSSNHKQIFIYLLLLAMAILTMAVIERLHHSRLGRAWIAMREDETACEAMGIDTTLAKLSAFGLGACWAGFAGAFYAARQGFINPESFTFIESATILAIVVLGGMGSIAGVTVAALAVVIIPELAREFSQYRMIIFACALVALMLFKPEGLLPARRRMYELHPEDRSEIEHENQSVREVTRQ